MIDKTKLKNTHNFIFILLFFFFRFIFNLILLFVLIYFSVRGARPGKNVQLSEVDIRNLCLKSREIFLSQPILLELEAPLKICGKLIIRYHFCFVFMILFSFDLPLFVEQKAKNKQKANAIGAALQLQ